MRKMSLLYSVAFDEVNTCIDIVELEEQRM